jgi:hypothetical protein
MSRYEFQVTDQKCPVTFGNPSLKMFSIRVGVLPILNLELANMSMFVREPTGSEEDLRPRIDPFARHSSLRHRSKVSGAYLRTFTDQLHDAWGETLPLPCAPLEGWIRREGHRTLPPLRERGGAIIQGIHHPLDFLINQGRDFASVSSLIHSQDNC